MALSVFLHNTFLFFVFFYEFTLGGCLDPKRVGMCGTYNVFADQIIAKNPQKKVDIGTAFVGQKLGKVT